VLLPNAVAETLANTRATLLAARDPAGHWAGALSSSALATATAVFTLQLAGEHGALQTAGRAWLARMQNPDGGWGDTVKSVSNISTTALVWAALAGDGPPDATTRAETWLAHAAGSLAPDKLAAAVKARYGKDHTFSVPILTMLALAGRLGPDPWRLVPQLPFELAACPHRWFQFLRLPVVSYALPALIAIGHVRHCFRPTWNPALRLVRRLVYARTLRKLREIQPTTGGYLEATPLTSFVCMSLVAAGRGGADVVAAGVEFLARSARPDGSWPIDTNLATWVTTLAVNALGGDITGAGQVRDWLLAQQYRTRHPYTHAAPGGWAWTDLAGGVPDADDTPGALLALAALGEPDERTVAAAAAGVTWLLDLQNRDGGIPTFCRGWTGLPFDRSSNDLTAHALLAWHAWKSRLSPRLQSRISAATIRAVGYLARTQRADGAWEPLWFGNQHAADTPNLTHGTSRVLRLAVLGDALDGRPEWRTAVARGNAWLRGSQHPSGGWGGRPGTPPSVEETALAIEALAADPEAGTVLAAGAEWLATATQRGTAFDPEPIGFYFANLWYFEALYPLVFTAAALRRYAGRHS